MGNRTPASDLAAALFALTRKVDEVGFSDLIAGGWIPATARVASFDLDGKRMAR